MALTFILLQMLPVNFGYPVFATLLFFNSVGMGLFIAPNQTGIMNSLPANQRGAGPAWRPPSIPRPRCSPSASSSPS